MSTRTLRDTEQGYQVMYDSAGMIAFGPVHRDEHGDLDDFIKWHQHIYRDAPTIADNHHQLMTRYQFWIANAAEREAADHQDYMDRMREMHEHNGEGR